MMEMFGKGVLAALATVALALIACLPSTAFANDIPVIAAAAAENSAWTIAPIAPQTFTGTFIKPALQVKSNSGSDLLLNTDYTIMWSNNKNVGMAKGVVRGKYNTPYQGMSTTVTFEILPLDLSGCSISPIDDQEWVGAAVTPSITVRKTSSNVVLAPSRYITVFSNNDAVGQATVTALPADGNLIGSISSDFNIVDPTVSSSSYDPSLFTCDPIAAQVWAPGRITPQPVVRYDGVVLDQSYYVTEWINCSSAGIGTVKVQGRDDTAYSGMSVSATFQITPCELATTAISLPATSYTYNGSAKQPVPTVKVNGVTLTRDTDYTVAYANNINAGTATVTITGKGNCKGSIKKAFAIAKAPQTITAKNLRLKYNGPAVNISATRTPTPGGKLRYSTSNSSVATVTSTGVVTPKNAGKAKITIKAAGTANLIKQTKIITVTVVKIAPTLVVTSAGLSADIVCPNLDTYQRRINVVSNSGGKITYKVMRSNDNLAFSNGLVTLKKGADAGSYSMSVKATVAATANYTSASKVFCVRFTANCVGYGYKNGDSCHQKQIGTTNCGATSFLVGSNILLKYHGKQEIKTSNIEMLAQLGGNTRRDLEVKGQAWYNNHYYNSSTKYSQFLTAYRGIGGNKTKMITNTNQLAAQLKNGNCVILCANNKARWKNANGEYQSANAHKNGHYIVFYYYDAKNKRFYANDSSRDKPLGNGAWYSEKEMQNWLDARVHQTTIILSYMGK